MNTGIKAILGAVVLIGLIGFKVYSRTPHWREAIKESRTMKQDQAFMQSFSLRNDLKLRLTATEKSGRPMLIYWLSKSDSDQLQGKKPNLERLMKKLGAQTLCEDGNLATPKEFELNNGDYCIYFEATPKEGETNTSPYQLEYLLEEYR